RRDRRAGGPRAHRLSRLRPRARGNGRARRRAFARAGTRAPLWCGRPPAGRGAFRHGRDGPPLPRHPGRGEFAMTTISPSVTAFPWGTYVRLLAECLQGPFMAEMQRRRETSGSVAHTIGRFDAASLYALVRIAQPRVVLETGTYRGVSAAFIAQAQQDAGVADAVVVSVDRLPAADLLVPEPLRSRVRLVHGDVRQLAAEPGALPAALDFFFHDSTHRYEHQFWEFTTFWPRLAPGGYLVSHDVNLNASFPQFVADTYRHRDGQVDRDRTTHTDWGRCGTLGFLRKNRGEFRDDGL